MSSRVVSLRLLVVLVLGLVLRLYHITDPYVLDFHDFRQADTAAFTHSYLTVSLNPIEPRLDRYPCTHRGRDFGLVEAELPIVAWLAALPLAAFGVEYPSPVYLRSVSVLMFLLTGFYLYLLVHRLSGSTTHACLSVLALSLFPYAIYFTRTIQPDGPALFFTAAFMFHLLVWAEGGRCGHLTVSGMLCASLFLLKVSNLFMLMPALFMVVQVRGVRGCFQIWLLVWLLIALVPPAAYYLHAHSYPWTFGIWPDREQSKFSTIRELFDLETWRLLSERLVFDILTWSGIVLAAAGLVRIEGDRTIKLALVWAGAVAIFFIMVVKGSRTHLYYQLPLALPAAILVGAGLIAFSGKWGRILVAGLLAVYLVTLVHTVEHRGWPLGKMGYYSWHGDAVEGIEMLVRHVGQGERFVSSDLDPVLYYGSGRRGWFETTPSVDRFLHCMGTDVDFLLLDTKTNTKLRAAPSQLKRLLSSLETMESGKHYTLYRKVGSLAGPQFETTRKIRHLKIRSGQDFP